MNGFAAEGIEGMWTPVALAKELRDRPLSVKLAGEPLVLFRDRKGGIGALRDQCPHRGVALSLGKVTDDGRLQCPFHGWQFEVDGACAKVPLNELPPGKRKLFGAAPFPARERAGLLWVYAREGADAPEEPYVPPALEDGKHRVGFVSVLWKCHWTRAMENMLDSPHLPFVHRKTIGRALRAKMTDDSVMEIAVQPTATGFHVTASLDGAEPQGFLRFNRPNGMMLHIPIPKRSMSMNVWCIPVDHEHTRMIIAGARDFARFGPLGRLFDRVNRLIADEDRAVVESSRPSVIPPPSEEKSVGSDRATLAFRRWWYERTTPDRFGAKAG